MKKLKQTVTATNLTDRIDALALVKKESIKASDFVNQPFKIEAYAKSHGVITDVETGEVIEENDGITIQCKDGVSFGSKSNTLMNAFDEWLDVLESMEEPLDSREFVIVNGQGKNGKYVTIEPTGNR